ncbi:MAG: AhpC/TSA family protein [Proteobacteria bacterium]|nr:AhpC/TSA family protein [Pseudomonadota bacterium]
MLPPITPLLPRQPVPALKVPLVGGGEWDLATQRPGNFSMIVFYRGLHCPICSRYLGDLDRRVEEFAKRGVSAIAISGDDAERAKAAHVAWKLQHLSIGYGLPLDVARKWGLYISSGRGPTSAGVTEPELFIEPGLFLVRPDGTLYCASVQTMPFARPSFAEVLQAIDFVVAKNYPARGEAA